MSYSGFGRIDLARLVEAGKLSKEEAGKVLIERALRRLRKLEARERKTAEPAE